MSQLKIKDGDNWIDIPAGGIGVPSGGTAGDVLIKSNSTDYATEWEAVGNILKYVDIPVALAQTNPISVSTGLSSSNKIVSTMFLYSADLYYALDKNTDNRVLTITTNANGYGTIVILQGHNIPATTRNVTVRVFYI